MNTLYDVMTIRRAQNIDQLVKKDKPTRFLVVGEIASGKSYLVAQALQVTGQRSVCSYTTRAKREREIEGKEHYYVSDVEFDKIMKESDIVAYTEFSGNRYCTTFRELNKAEVYVITPDGVEYLREHWSDVFNFIVIYVHVPYRIRRQRASIRSDFETKFNQRVEVESVEFFDFVYNRKWDYLLDNSGEFTEVLKELIEVFDLDFDAPSMVEGSRLSSFTAGETKWE